MADVDQQLGVIGDRVDRGAARDRPDVDRGGRCAGEDALADRDRLVHGAGTTAIRPRVPAGSGHGDAVADRGDAAHGQAVDAVSLDRDQSAHGLAIEQRADPAQIAEALLTDGEGDQDGGGGWCEHELAGDVQEHCDAECVVADAGADQAPALPAHGQRGIGRKDRVEMRTHGERWPVIADPRDHVAHVVEGRIEAQCMQAGEHFLAAQPLRKGRRGDQAERLRSVADTRHGLGIGDSRSSHGERVTGISATHV